MTAQIHEELILEGEATSMAFCPPLPDSHPRVVRRPPHLIDPEDHDYGLLSTACWRCYQGTWEIRDGRFYLVGLRGCFALRGDGPLLADWFSGVLRIPKGKRLLYVHMGFGSVYERELHIKIENGLVTATRVIDNRDQTYDRDQLAWDNLPGGENRFVGDTDL